MKVHPTPLKDMRRNLLGYRVEIVQDSFGESDVLAEVLKENLGENGKVLLVADSNVVSHTAELGPKIGRYMNDHGLSIAGKAVVIPGGEKVKYENFSSAFTILDTVVRRRLGEGDCILALGGGVVRDLIIGKTPPVMFENYSYLAAAMITSLAVFVVMFLLKKITIQFLGDIMAVFNKEKVRNIALIGHGGEGKTSLLEAILFCTKGIDRLGKVDDGTTVGDFDAEEIKRKMSISLSLAYAYYNDYKINFIDTPGFFDFEGEMVSALTVADGAIVVTQASGSLSVGAEKALDYCVEKKIPVMIFVGGLNKENSNYFVP